MCWHQSYSCPPRPEAIRGARNFTAQSLSDRLGDDVQMSDVIADARLVVSELVTNAVAAASTSLTVDVELHHDHLRIAVSDDAVGLPVERTSSVTDDHGRGLLIVRQLARNVGVVSSADGKEVWAELALPRPLTEIECEFSA